MDTFCRSSDQMYLIKKNEKKELKKTFKHKLLAFSPFIVEMTIKSDGTYGKTAVLKNVGMRHKNIS